GREPWRRCLQSRKGAKYRKIKRPFPPTACPLSPPPCHRTLPPSRSPVREARSAAWQGARLLAAQSRRRRVAAQAVSDTAPAAERAKTRGLAINAEECER